MRIAVGQIRAGDLDVDGRGHAEAEHGVDQAARLEVRGDLRHLLRNAAAHARHVFVAADLVIFLQADLTVAVCMPELLV